MPFFSNAILLEASSVDSLGSAVSQFTSIFSTVWIFLTSNWYFSALIVIPLVGLVISVILGFIRSAR